MKVPKINLWWLNSMIIQVQGSILQPMLSEKLTKKICSLVKFSSLRPPNNVLSTSCLSVHKCLPFPNNSSTPFQLFLSVKLVYLKSLNKESFNKRKSPHFYKSLIAAMASTVHIFSKIFTSNSNYSQIQESEYLLKCQLMTVPLRLTLWPIQKDNRISPDWI